MDGASLNGGRLAHVVMLGLAVALSAVTVMDAVHPGTWVAIPALVVYAATGVAVWYFVHRAPRMSNVILAMLVLTLWADGAFLTFGHNGLRTWVRVGTAPLAVIAAVLFVYEVTLIRHNDRLSRERPLPD